MKYVGVKRASSLSKYTASGRGYVQVSYDLKAKRLYSEWLVSSNNWIRYNESTIVTVLNIYYPMSMKEIEQELEYWIPFKTEEYNSRQQ